MPGPRLLCGRRMDKKLVLVDRVLAEPRALIVDASSSGGYDGQNYLQRGAFYTASAFQSDSPL